MVACLEKSEGNADFHEIVDFLTASSVHYTLTVSPAIYASYIEQFWNTAHSQTVSMMVKANSATILLRTFVNEYSTPAHTKKVFTNMKRKGKDFSGRVTPLFASMLAPPVVEGEGSGQPSEPQPTPSTAQPRIEEQIPVTESSSPQNTQSPRKALQEDTQCPQTSMPILNIADESVFKGWDGKVLRATTTAASLDVAQASGNISKTQSTTMSNDPLSQEISSGDRPRCQEAIGVSLLRLGLRGHLNIPMIHLSPGKKKGMKLFKIGTSKRKSLDEEYVSKQGRKSDKTKPMFDDSDFAKIDVDNAMENVEVNTANIDVSAAGPSDISTADPSTSTAGDIFEDEMMTIADTLVAIRSTRQRTTSVIIHDVEEEPRRSTPSLTAQPSSKDKGKGLMVEPEKPPKNPRKAQIQMDEELAIRLHEEEKAELERMQRERATQEKASNAALIAEFDNVQARMEADALLTAILQEKGKRAVSMKSQASFLWRQCKRKRFFAAQRAKQIRNKPPTKIQLRNKMITYLKNIGRFTYNQLKNKSFKKFRSDKKDKWIKIFLPMDSEEGGKKAKAVKKNQELKLMKERVRNHTEAYQIFADMLKKFDRDDLVKLWDLVKNSSVTTSPTYDEKRNWINKEEVLAAGDDMDEDIQADEEIRTPSPKQDQPEPSQVQESASDSSSPDLKKFDNILPLTERQLIKDQTDKLVESSTSSLDRSSTTISDLYKGMDVITQLLKDINNAFKDDLQDTSEIKSMMVEIYKAFEGQPSSVPSGSVTPTLALTHIPANFKGENATNTATEEPPSHTEGETRDRTMAIPISSIHPTEVQPTHDQPITLVISHPENSHATLRIDKGKGIATEPDVDPSKRIVPASTIIRPDPDEPVRDKEEKIKKDAEKAKLLVMSRHEVIKLVQEEAEKIGLDPRKIASAKAGKKFKKAQDSEHEVLKREHSKKPEPITDVRIHPNTKPIVASIFRINDKRNFDVHQPFKFLDFGITKLDELGLIIQKKKNSIVKDLMTSLSKRYERFKKILEELGIQFALPALVPKQASSQNSGRKRKHMELEPEVKVPGLECNRSLPEGVPFVNHMVIEELEYGIFFINVFGDQAFQRWDDIHKVGVDCLVSYMVMASMVKTEENARFSLKLRKMIADHPDQDKLKS
ncbi:hypothetical protein Tco_0200314 [Tanacetum coccineum]